MKKSGKFVQQGPTKKEGNDGSRNEGEHDGMVGQERRNDIQHNGNVDEVVQTHDIRLLPSTGVTFICKESRSPSRPLCGRTGCDCWDLYGK